MTMTGHARAHLQEVITAAFPPEDRATVWTHWTRAIGEAATTWAGEPKVALRLADLGRTVQRQDGKGGDTAWAILRAPGPECVTVYLRPRFLGTKPQDFQGWEVVPATIVAHLQGDGSLAIIHDRRPRNRRG